MPHSPDRIALRLAHIVHAVLTDVRGYRVDQLIDDLGIKPRTYRKYRSILRDEFPPFQGPDGESRLREVTEGEARWLRLVDVGRTEPGESFVPRIAAIHLARELLGFLSDTPVGEAMADLVAEFRQRTHDQSFFYDHLFANLDRLFYQVPYAAKDYRARGETLRVVLGALLFMRRLSMTYDSASGARSEMTVEPLTLAAYRGGLYLIARHVDFEEPRTFAVDRIERVEKLEQRFGYPPAHRYHPRQFTEGCFGIYRGGDGSDRTTVELIFADKRWLQLDVRERQWHPTQSFEQLGDGRLRMTFTVSTMVEVWPWIRSFGDDVEVVQPGR